MLSLEKWKSLKQKPFTADFIGGGMAGAFTGMIVAPVEALKIEFQRRPELGARAIMQDSATHQNMLKAIPPFSVIFSAVCALEFSVNERIKHNYGQLAGVAASALTGSGFLTVADHLMFRRQHGENAVTALKNLTKVRLTAPWTGFTPMAAREAIFITSVMYLGPTLGKKLQSGSEQNSLYWNSVGRLITGVTTTMLSQPFDVMAREMQIQLHQNPDKNTSLLSAYNSIRSKLVNGSHVESVKQLKHPLFLGAVPRMGLATFGGVLAGGFFQQFRSAISEEQVVEHKPTATVSNKLR